MEFNDYIENHSLDYFIKNSSLSFMLNQNIKYDENFEYDMKRSCEIYDSWMDHEGETSGVTVDSIWLDKDLLALYELIIQESVENGINNISIQEYKDFGMVRFAIGQVWINYRLIQKSSVLPLVTIIKRKANLNYQLESRNIPQTRGRIKFKETFFRVYSARDFYGDYVNLRLLDEKIIEWDNLKIPREIAKRLEQRVFQQNSRMLFVGGPTGSGKSTTQNSILNHMVRKSNNTLNIYSLEEPIEVPIDGVIQIDVDEKFGPTYEESINGILRGQPNLIRINEISNKATAKSAVRSSASGITSMATLHINSALEVFETLKSYEVDENDIKNSIGEVLYMLRPSKLCPHCRKPSLPIGEEYQWVKKYLADGNEGLITSPPFKRNESGCDICREKNFSPLLYGYLGSVSVYEYLEVNRPMLRLWRRFKQYDYYVLKDKLLHPQDINWEEDEESVKSDLDSKGNLGGIVYFPLEVDILDKLNKGLIDIPTARNIINN